MSFSHLSIHSSIMKTFRSIPFYSIHFHYIHLFIFLVCQAIFFISFILFRSILFNTVRYIRSFPFMPVVSFQSNSVQSVHSFIHPSIQSHYILSMCALTYIHFLSTHMSFIIYHLCICPSIHSFTMQSFHDFRRCHSRHASLAAITCYAFVSYFQ